MRRLSVLIAMFAGLLAVAPGLVAAPALAAQTTVVADCTAHNRLTHTYSVPELRNALSTMTADVKEYTDCYDVIQRALLAQIGGSHPTGVAGTGGGSGGSFLPTPLIVVLVLLGLAAVTFGAVGVRRRRGGDTARDRDEQDPLAGPEKR